jgi:hypothetical protein
MKHSSSRAVGALLCVGSAFCLGCATRSPTIAAPATVAPATVAPATVAPATVAIPTATATPIAPHVVFKQDESTLNEVSGVAVVRSQPGLLWMHNDSGDTARMFAVNGQGKIALTVNLDGAGALDWEDCDAQGAWVYAGDIGDNLLFRSDIQIYRFKDPKINPNKTGVQLTLKPKQWQMMTLRWPDGAHNCESLAATPDGRLLLVSKEESGLSGFYVLDKPFKDKGAATLRKIGSFGFGMTGVFTKLSTGADFSPDGRKLVVTTYSDLYEFPLGRAFDFSSLRLVPLKEPLPPQKQCEAVCYSLDGKTIFSTGEGKNQPVWQVASGLK